MKWVMQFGRLARLMKGVSAKYMQRFYTSITVPRMLYAIDLFLILRNRNGRGTRGFINKLRRIQRQASLHITSMMRTAPTDTIDSCADLLPFHLLVEKLTHHTATCLATLPRSHPLVTHVWEAVGRYVKRHRAPLHEILHGFSIWPGDYEDIKPMRAKPGQEPHPMVHIPVPRERVIEEVGELREEVRMYSDGSGIGGQVGAASCSGMVRK